MKGTYGCECNRTMCTNNNAQFFNHSTKKYYCTECAHKINKANKKDALRLFGHDICTFEKAPTQKEKTFIKSDFLSKHTKNVRRMNKKIGRNSLCFCESGIKYKHCCMNK